jgi:hypothetical protein
MTATSKLPSLGPAAAYRQRRLMHDANLVAKPCRHAPARELLQRDEPIGAGERAQTGAGSRSM